MDITVQELKQRMDAGENLHLLDVRNPDEYEADNIGAKLIPLGDLPASTRLRIGKTRKCSSTAARASARPWPSKFWSRTASLTSAT